MESGFIHIKHKDLGYYSDMVWPYLHLEKDELRYKKMKWFRFEHANQEPIYFWMNTTFVPGIVVNRGKDEDNWSDRNSETELGRSVEKSGGCVIHTLPRR